MAAKKSRNKTKKTVEIIAHEEASRKNIPTAEFQSVMRKEEQSPIQLAYERRNRDLDPQLVWRGKEEQDWSDLVAYAPPLYIQEKVHPKVLIDDLLKRTQAQKKEDDPEQLDLFVDFNGLPDEAAKTEFYQHDANWSNRMILGDSLQVMASLAEREGLRGKVQCIYIDPPYGIKFNSNFQWSTTSRSVTDGKTDHITREPEQVKAFRDTWRDGIHSFLTYLRDRLIVARDLLNDRGSIFVQIGDENVHRIRVLMDEVFGDRNFCALIPFQKTSGGSVSFISADLDYLLWYGKNRDTVKYRPVRILKDFSALSSYKYAIKDFYSNLRALTKEEKENINLVPPNEKNLQISFLGSQDPGRDEDRYYKFRGKLYDVGTHRHWKTSNPEGLDRLSKASRIYPLGAQLNYMRLAMDASHVDIGVLWNDVGSAGFSNADPKVYVVQTDTNVVARCIGMTTDPGDLVLDPTCGAGTSAYVSEQWGRRWITIDTSRVALALARTRIMGARYPYYILADSREGQLKEAEITRKAPSETPTYENIRQGFVYERVPHITLKSIANNAEIDVIWENFQETLEPLRKQLNKALKKEWEEWEIPREAEDLWDKDTQEIFYTLQAELNKNEKANVNKVKKALIAINANLGREYTLKTLPERPADPWPEEIAQIHAQWWEQRVTRQKEIDISIATKADYEYLYDKPYENNKKVRVAGPFTVESLSPHRVLAVDEDDELINRIAEPQNGYGEERDFTRMILENLKTAGVQQAHKEDRITFTSITPWPGEYVCAEGRYIEGDEETGVEKRAAIFIGPEFGTVSRPDLVASAREAGDADFDSLIACAFNYDAHSSEFEKLGRIPVLKARMNADLHMAEDLKNTGKGNLFVIFGEPDIDIIDAGDEQIQVKINGVDVFHPNTGEIRSDGAEGIACWFIDTDYNEESFFVRHAYFLGANDPYKSLKTTLKAELNEEAWATLNSDISRPFDKPESGRMAVKVINHLGDEVMKVFRVDQ